MLLFACVSLVFWSRTPHRGRGGGRWPRAREAQGARAARAAAAGARADTPGHSGAGHTRQGAAHYAGSLLCMLPTRYNAKDTRC